MPKLSKQFMAYIHAILEAFGSEEDQKPIDSDILAFVQWLFPIEEERDEEYQEAFTAVLGRDPLWIPCMQCEHDGIFYDGVSEPRPRLTFFGQTPYIRASPWASGSYKTLPGERILIGKCQKCGITEHLHTLVIIRALKKRKKVTGHLFIPAQILGESGL
jgi:hypothetical protein